MQPTTCRTRPKCSYFFDLPRELRDEVYKQYCFSAPRSEGPLEGYVDLPSAHPLSVCQQMQAEFQPVFDKGLEHTVLQNRVCLKIKAYDTDDKPRYAGWNIWTHDTGHTATIWIRDGAEEEDRFAAWWIGAKCLHRWSGDVALHCDGTWLGFSQLCCTLEKLQDLATRQKRSGAVKARLRYVCWKLNAGLAEAENREDVEKVEEKLGVAALTPVQRMNRRRFRVRW